jgi:hypothetical protein
VFRGQTQGSREAEARQSRGRSKADEIQYLGSKMLVSRHGAGTTLDWRARRATERGLQMLMHRLHPDRTPQTFQ